MNTATTSNIQFTVNELYRAGVSVVPPREDGSKSPDTDSWTLYQKQRATINQLREWYANGRRGVGAVCGAVSGNLELFEFDERATYEQFKDLATQSGLGELVARVSGGYEEETPGGGIHWLYRCEEIGRNTKLACRPKRPDEMEHAADKRKPLIETRGEGGYGILAPSSGSVHPSGKPYTLLQGSAATIATIAPDERAALWELARAFDQMPRQAAGEHSKPENRGSMEGERPGDVFNASATWEDTGLFTQGWHRAFEHNGVVYLRRPGKRTGVSATLNYKDTDLLYVFTTSSEFDAERGYSKFSVYAILNHGGDFKAAATELKRRGYGAQAPNTNRTSSRNAEPREAPTKTGSALSGIVCLADVQPERVRWMWQGRFAFRKLNMVDGDPGLGKSVITVDLAARGSRGLPMPDGSVGDISGPYGSVFLSAEDGLADTIRPRLDAAGADVSRIVALTAVTEPDGSVREPTLADIADIERAIAVVDAKVVFIDPIMAYIPDGVETKSDHSVRRSLRPLADLAERTGVAVIVLRHLNKAVGGNPLYRGGGSIAFIGAARSGVLVAKDPNDESGLRHVMVVTKTNLSRPAPALDYHLETAENGSVRVVWDGASAHTAASVLASMEPEERTAMTEAMDFLRDELQEGERRVPDVEGAAKQAGIAQITLQRARKRLSIKSERRGGMGSGGYWVWVLPATSEAEAEIDVEAQNVVNAEPIEECVI